ncbi:sugar-binding protein [Novosphingobium guangzhouense]|uniref:substrate-binding domain-containing protein n=1 Tax=Novosphingobium guangzhouense TaxID=1850347 RepID=UPI001B80B3EE|nr:sugar-binding protein [Novosphingobium guangzhouense]
MRKRRIAAAAMALTVLSVALTGCNEHKSPKGTIGITLTSKTEARWVSDGNNMVKALKAMGYDVDIQYAQYDVPVQLSQVENLVAKKVRGLIIAPIDGTTMVNALKQAHEQGIPVISYDRLIRGTPDVDYYVTFDNRQTGVLQGKDIVDKLGLKQGKGPFNLEIFSGALDDNNAHVVYAGVMSQLKPYIDSGKLVVRSHQVSLNQTATANWDGATAQARMDNLLSAFYGKDHLDAVLAMNDSIATGVVSSLKSVGYGSGGTAMPVITGQDAEVPNVKSIVRGDQTSTIFKDTRALANAAAQMMDAKLSGRPVTVNDTKSYDNGAKVLPSLLLQPQLIDKSNWREKLVTKGKFYTAQQIEK